MFYSVLDTLIDEKKIFRQPEPEFGGSDSRWNIRNIVLTKFVRLWFP